MWPFNSAARSPDVEFVSMLAGSHLTAFQALHICVVKLQAALILRVRQLGNKGERGTETFFARSQG